MNVRSSSPGPVSSTPSEGTSLNAKVDNSNLVLALRAFCGFTGSAYVAQALNPNVKWVMHSTLPLILLNFFIHQTPKEESSCTLEEKISRCSKCIFSNPSIFFFSCGLGLLSSILINVYVAPFNRVPYSDQLNTNILLFQGFLLTTHLLSSYAVRYFQQPILKKAARSQNKEFTTTDLLPEILMIKEKNIEWEEKFKRLKVYINNNAELMQAYKACFEQTKNILLPPYEMGEITSTDSIIAEWEKEAKLELYYNALNTRLNDFLLKNPDFYALLKNDLEKQGQGAIHGK